jgi:hypothetical protein
MTWIFEQKDNELMIDDHCGQHQEQQVHSTRPAVNINANQDIRQIINDPGTKCCTLSSFTTISSAGVGWLFLFLHFFLLDRCVVHYGGK